ncbi:probable ATP-dependent RNA helicase DDX20 [Ornithodoros turicata]|uniref:probable ATP-dependent RNA helicase DDX20 n=1 Tax=Ornithodoros turicata TaxID=34597 RepID=UPI0031397260
MARRVAHNLDVRWRSNDVKHTEDVTFANLMLSNATLSGLRKAGFERPSPVQLQAIPLGLCGFDLVVQAKSGTGKTCVFSVISLERISLDTGRLQVLILAPTREIAVQSCDVLNCIGCDHGGLACYAFIGGIPRKEDEKKLEKCHIAVGTPGRIKQLIELGVMKTSSIRLFVLDEADKLLHDSFEESISWIYACLPESKQVMALSATYPIEMAALLKKYLNNPSVIRIGADDPALLGLAQFYKVVPHSHQPGTVFRYKLQFAVEILRKLQFSQCLIFLNSQARAKSLVEALKVKNLPADLIAGNQTQTERLTSLARLKGFRCRILVSTDLTARGIDAEQVNLVINYDIPWDLETYLHRTGRAGRYGTSGTCISFVTSQELESFLSLCTRGNIEITTFPDLFPCSLKADSDDTENCGSGKDQVAKEIKASAPEQRAEVQQPGFSLLKHKSLQDAASELLGLVPTKYLSFDEAVKCCREGEGVEPAVTRSKSWSDSIDIELCKSMNRLILGWRSKQTQNLDSLSNENPQTDDQRSSSPGGGAWNSKITTPQEKLPKLADCACEGGCPGLLQVQPTYLGNDSETDTYSSSEESFFGEQSSVSDGSSSDVSDELGSDDIDDSRGGSSEDDSSESSSDSEDIESDGEGAYSVTEPPHYHPNWGSLRRYSTGEAWDEAPWCRCYACECSRLRARQAADSGRGALNWSRHIFAKYAYYIRQMLMRRSVYFNS